MAIRLFLLGLLLATSSTVAAENKTSVRAEVVWIDAKPDYHHVMLSSLEQDEWRQPVAIYTSENSLSSPAISTDHDGNKLLIWSELRDEKVVLMQVRRQLGADSWSKPSLFSDYGNENFGATMLVDGSNQTWVFWSANKGGLDDIVYVTGHPSRWSRPSLAHRVNEVPDYLASARLNRKGDLVLRWQTFDHSTGTYIQADRLFELDKSPESGYKTSQNMDEDVSITDVSLPLFVPANTASMIHFPTNKLIQSLRLEQLRQ